MNSITKMRKPYIQLCSLLVLLLTVNACQKKEFTEPVAVQLLVKMAEGNSSSVSFEAGTVLFDQILFDGQRQQGGSVHFTTEAGKAVGPVHFSKETERFIKSFDIPQGVYTHMQWHFLLGDIDELTDDETDTFEPEGGLVLYAYLNRADGSQLPLRIVVDDDEQLMVKVLAGDSYGDITLSAVNSYEMQLILDPYYAVRTISAASWEEADVEEDGEQTYVEVSSDENEDLYETILFRLESSATIVIQ